MADNIDILDGNGAHQTVAADQISSAYYERNKLAAGEDGVYTGDVGGAHVDGHANRSALYVRERPDIQINQPTVTVSTSPAYTANDNVGGAITLSSVVATAGNAIRPLGLTIASGTNPGALSVFLLRDSLAGTYTDNGAFTLAAADRPKVVAVWNPTPASEGGTYWTQLGPSEIDYMPPFTVVGTAVYLLIATAGAPTFASTSEVKVNFHYERL